MSENLLKSLDLVKNAEMRKMVISVCFALFVNEFSA